MRLSRDSQQPCPKPSHTKHNGVHLLEKQQGVIKILIKLSLVECFSILVANKSIVGLVLLLFNHHSCFYI